MLRSRRGESLMSGNCFAVCSDNEGYESSLELRKLYLRLTDPSAERLELVRVVDESGEDYLFPASFFEPIEISEPLQKKLLRAD